MIDSSVKNLDHFHFLATFFIFFTLGFSFASLPVFSAFGSYLAYTI
jgi:hypothetical protein